MKTEISTLSKVVNNKNILTKFTTEQINFITTLIKAAYYEGCIQRYLDAYTK